MVTVTLIVLVQVNSNQNDDDGNQINDDNSNSNKIKIQNNSCERMLSTGTQHIKEANGVQVNMYLQKILL